MKASSEVKVSFSYFEKTVYLKKNNEQEKPVEVLHTSKNLKGITEFISGLLQKIIHHWNQLKNFRSIIFSFREHHEADFIDIDFSEKLKIPIKFQAQSQHWNERTVIVHSGILYSQGVKSYHTYLSDDKDKEQAFVSDILEKMIEQCNFDKINTLIVEKDNCTSQYKCAEHFSNLSKIATENNVKLSMSLE